MVVPIAHDFNNAIVGIVCNASLALSKVDENNEVHRFLSNIEYGAKHAQYLIQQLLTFSKDGALIKTKCDINLLIKNFAEFITRGTKSKCQFDFAKDLWFTEVDKEKINQVLGNLLTNANQAMANGGIINVRTENVEIGTTQNFLLSEKRYIKIEIKDHGVGISEENIPKLFEPFFTTKQNGKGIGLYASKSIIKKHGGQIFVESKQNEGTIFSLYLPASSNDLKQEKNYQINSQQSTMKILIMEDQIQIFKMLKKLLKNIGYESDCVIDGIQAIEAYRKAYCSNQPYDLVILDLNVSGGMNGVETIQKIREINPMVKAILSSGSQNDPILANFRDYGFCAVAPKPYSIKLIVNLIDLILGNQKNDLVLKT